MNDPQRSMQSSAAQLQRAKQVQQLQQNQVNQQKLQQQSGSEMVSNGNRAKPLPHQFATSSLDILKKYSKYPASLTFHIYETHYRFNNSLDSNIIPKSSPMIKNFLKCILKEQIPVEMTELLKDFSIRLYDGCLILQVYDHREMVPTGVATKTEVKLESPGQKDQKQEDATSVVSKPKTYRTLLRPTQLSLYYDLLYHTDSALSKFTDTLALQMESEILTLTNRKLDLSVPLNPYLCDDYLKPDVEYPKKVWDEKTNDYKLVHRHTEEVPTKKRKLHQDELVLHKSSEYEEIMLLLSTKYKRVDESEENKLIVVGSSSSAAAANAASGGSSSSNGNLSTSATPSAGSKKDLLDKKKIEKPSTVPALSVIPAQTSTRTTGQFMRLRLIEEIRKRRNADKARQEQKIQEQANALNQSNTRPLNENPPQQPIQQMRQAPAIVPQTETKTEQGASHLPLRANDDMNARMGQMNSAAGMMRQRQQGQAFPNQAAVPAQAQAARPISNPVQQNLQAANTMINQGAASTATAAAAAAMKAASASSNPQQLQQQQQQQQIFQNTLTPEEQQHFRHLQSRMTAFAQMGNSGTTPNGQKLNPQQQQQALQQAKLIQQQLFQKYPVFFRSLKQFQIIQQQRQQGQVKQQTANGSASQMPNMRPQGMQRPGMAQAQSPDDKKKRVYNKKTG